MQSSCLNLAKTHSIIVRLGCSVVNLPQENYIVLQSFYISLHFILLFLHSNSFHQCFLTLLIIFGFMFLYHSPRFSPVQFLHLYQLPAIIHSPERPISQVIHLDKLHLQKRNVLKLSFARRILIVLYASFYLRQWLTKKSLT